MVGLFIRKADDVVESVMKKNADEAAGAVMKKRDGIFGDQKKVIRSLGNRV